MRRAVVSVILALLVCSSVIHAYPSVETFTRYRSPSSARKDDNATYMTPCDVQASMCEANSCLRDCAQEHEKLHIGSYCKITECMCVHK